MRYTKNIYTSLKHLIFIQGICNAFNPSQGQFPDVDDGEIRDMDARISELSAQCKEKDEEVRRLDAGIEFSQRF